MFFILNIDTAYTKSCVCYCTNGYIILEVGSCLLYIESLCFLHYYRKIRAKTPNSFKPKDFSGMDGVFSYREI